MALSAFGDPLSSFGDPLDEEPAQPSQSVPAAGPVTTQPQTATQPQVSAFGDDLHHDEPNRTAGQWVTDIGGSVGRGAYNLFDALSGLGDIATGGAATPWLAAHGMDSREARAVLDAEMSPQARAQQQEVADAKGFGATAKAIAQNPAYAAGQVIESVPTMVAGGVAGKAVGLGSQLLGAGERLAAITAAGASQAIPTAGQVANQITQQTGDLTPGQTGLALLAGGATGLLGAAGARIARGLGVADINQQLAGNNGADIAKGLVNRVLTGSGIESIEQLTQAGQQQVLTNIATDRPPLEGVDKQAAMAGVMGGVMGAAGGLRRPDVQASLPEQAPRVEPDQSAPVQDQQAQQQQGMPQGLHAQVMDVLQNKQPAATPVELPPAAKPEPTMPFAGSQDISPLLDRLGLQGDQRTQTMDLLKPVELNVEDARRGVLPNAERDRLATLIGLQGSDAQVFNRKIGEALNAEQTVALTTHVQDNLKDVLDLQQRITSGNASDIDRASFVQSLGQLRSTFADLAGARAEAGRALSAYKRQAMDFTQAKNVLEAVGGINGADDAAKALGKAIQSGGLSNAAKLISAPESKMSRLLNYYYRAALLSGVRTHVVNITSNAITLGNEIIERGIAAGVSGVKNVFKPGSGQTIFAEPIDMLVGMSKNFMQAGSAAVDAFKTGEAPTLGIGKGEVGPLGGMNSPRPNGVLGTGGWAADKLASVPYRALGAEDAFFANMNYAGELRTIARQNALAEKKLGTLPANTKLSQRIDQLVQSPTPSMIEAAGEHARTATFNNQAGVFAQAVMSAKAKMPWLNLVVPFIRTPANIVTYGLKRTPAAPLFKSVREDLAAGGAKQERAIARMLWGTSVMVGAGVLAQAGYITGAGPDDKKEKAALLAKGWRPYSIKVGDTYHEYNRLDPFSQWLGLASDLSTMDFQHKDAADLAATALGSLVNNTVNKTYMQGVSNLVEFMQDPKRNGPWYLRQMGGTLGQPVTLMSNIASERDPYAREQNSVLDAIKYRVPGLRQDLPTRLDAFGEPVPNRTYPGGPLSIAAPIAQSKESTDPVRLETARLGWVPGNTADHFTISKHRFDLNDGQKHEFDQLTGQMIHTGMARIMAAPGWKSLNDDQKRDLLDSLAKKARVAVRTAFTPYMVNGDRKAINKLKTALGRVHP
jgi:hypothetical protein